MTLAGNVDALAERIADEFNDVRSEVSTSLSGKSDTGHNHDSSYYTESETDTLLAGKSSTSHDHDSDYSDIAHTHTHPNVPQSWQSLSSGSTLTMDCDLGTRFRCSALTENTTVADPTDKADGQQLLLAVVASGGTRTVALNGSIVNMTGDTFPVSVGSGKRWIGGFLIEGSTALLIASKVQP